MKSIAIIPARYSSTRLPGKPLLDIGGLPMFVRVWKNISSASNLDKTIVATDDDRIAKVAEEYEVPYVMTSPDLQSGTDRLYAATELIDEEYDLIVNVQGDEPFLLGEDIELLLNNFNCNKYDVATFIQKINSSEDLSNPNIVKVAINEKGKAVYFSRSPIPYLRDYPIESWLQQRDYWRHIGVYAYSYNALKSFAELPPSDLEKTEKLEQLRLLEKGFAYKCIELERELIGIDTPEDYEKVKQMIEKNEFRR